MHCIAVIMMQYAFAFETPNQNMKLQLFTKPSKDAEPMSNHKSKYENTAIT